MRRRTTISTRPILLRRRAPARNRRLHFYVFAFVLRRVALIVPTFIGVTLLAFALIHLIPGDPVENLSGERGMDPARRERLLHEFGLDKPLPQQYVEYIGEVLKGDL